MPDARVAALRAARRVAVVGGGGAGKTVLALRLGRALQLPVVHLDAEYWLPGWIEPDRGAWSAHHAALVARERWLIDGNYGGTQEARFARSDVVIFLDYPARIMVWRLLRRTLRWRGRARPEMAPGCAERLDFTFLRYVWRFPRLHAPRVREKLARFPNLSTIVLRDPRETEKFVRRLETRAAT